MFDLCDGKKTSGWLLFERSQALEAGDVDLCLIRASPEEAGQLHPYIPSESVLYRRELGERVASLPDHLLRVAPERRGQCVGTFSEASAGDEILDDVLRGLVAGAERRSHGSFDARGSPGARRIVRSPDLRRVRPLCRSHRRISSLRRAGSPTVTRQRLRRAGEDPLLCTTPR